ncbi:MAG: IS1380 family transposase [Nitrospinota bacterium]
MGERKKWSLRVQFDKKLKLEFHGSKITSDAGLLAYRELDDALGLTETAEELFSDYRKGKNKQHSLLSMFRQSVYGRLGGYEDLNDAERLRVDPAMRHIVGGRAQEKAGASTSEMGRFETQILSQKENLKNLMTLPGKFIDKIIPHKKLSKLILDMDSSVSETHGKQQGSDYNGHFSCTCYHPLFLFNQDGDLENAMLRRGSNHSAKYWRKVLPPVVERYRPLDIPRFFRGDAAFANPDLLSFLENEKFKYAIRIKSNAILMEKVSHLMTRPLGRPSFKPKVYYHTFQYQARSWECIRKIIAKIEWHCGEIFPRIGFIVTNMDGWAKNIVRFYNGRGTAEQWIKEGKNAVKWTRLSCRNFRDNQVRLQLFALAYNLGNFLRKLALPRKVKHWSLTTLREKLIKIGAKIVERSRYVYFQMAEVAVPRDLFAVILNRIDKLRLEAT